MAFSDDLKTITPAISEIKTGTPGIKIGSAYIVGGIGGNFIPAGPGTSTPNYYKCASVDTTNQRWSGYKAILTDSGCTFEETLTTGLSYPSASIPEVGHVYTEQGLLLGLCSVYYSDPDGQTSSGSSSGGSSGGSTAT